MLYIPLTFTNSLYSIDKSIRLHSTQIFNQQKVQKKKDLWYSSKITSSSLSIFSDFPPNLFNVDRFGKVFSPTNLFQYSLSVGILFQINNSAFQFSFRLRVEKETEREKKMSELCQIASVWHDFNRFLYLPKFYRYSIKCAQIWSTDVRYVWHNLGLFWLSTKRGHVLTIFNKNAIIKWNIVQIIMTRLYQLKFSEHFHYHNNKNKSVQSWVIPLPVISLLL